MNSDWFAVTLRPADANNIVLLLDFNQILSVYEPFKTDNIVEHTIALEDLHAKIGLFSLLESGMPPNDINNALASEAADAAAWAKINREGQKVYLELYVAKGNGPWILRGEEILQNRNSIEQPWSLMRLLGSNPATLMGESIKIGVKIASKAQGVGGLKGNDYIHLSGTWRKNTVIEPKKKDDSIEALNNRIKVLEGIVGEKLSQLPENILLGRAAGTGIGAAQNIANNFATTEALTTGLATKVGTTGSVTVAGTKTFTNVLRLQSTSPGFWLDETDQANKGAFFVLDSGYLQIQRRAGSFGAFEGNPFYFNLLTGDFYIGGFLNAAGLPASPTGLPAGTFYRAGNTVMIT